MLSNETLQFLADLTENNNREWFTENKKRYEKFKADYHHLVVALLAEMKPLDPSLELLEVKNCVFRINRDIRFSKDKTPYKNHIGIWMSSGAKNANLAGYYVHIGPEESFIAGGFHSPETTDLKKIRKEIAFFYDDLEEIVNEKSFKTLFGALDRNENNSLKNAPKDYEKDHPAIEFLKLKNFTATQIFDFKEVTKSDFVKKTAAKLIVLKPLNDFINRALLTEE
ncbi:DUF2461 domain-containing protein [Flavobacterium sp.]|uniref:DUF2461 domain-containing protein n=1 Tax=Flavobacterium sp. TaxID=239 RepID=UPI0026114135|nr:DUF2461 domain-containing protein [Flavobacterium sp.]MDD3004440.1 DUF2461 domain-containing protein [Flavobacterium sp.]